MDSNRVIAIILEETNKAEQRYPEYRNDLRHTVAEVVNLERLHRLSARNIKQDVAAQINTLAGEVVHKRGGVTQ